MRLKYHFSQNQAVLILQTQVRYNGENNDHTMGFRPQTKKLKLS